LDSSALIFNGSKLEHCEPEVIGMSIKIRECFIMRFTAGTLFAVTAACGLSGASLAAPGEDTRTSNSSHIVSGGRSNTASAYVSSEEYDALVTAESRDKTQSRAGTSKPGAAASHNESAGFDFWFYDVDVQLFNDDDFDGYYHGIDVLFDVDTNFSAAGVYAVFYLSLEGGPWNEYAVTEDFTVFGTSASDEYVLVTELLSGYPTGSYDLLIELFDVYDGTFLASFGPEDSSAASFLALEDFHRDAPRQEVVIVESHGGGGALEVWLLGILLLLLLGQAIRKSWRHRNDALMRIDSPLPIWQDGRGHRTPRR
jgi:hypothetical protein